MKLAYQNIPEDARDFLYGPEVSLAYDEIVEKNQLQKGSDALLMTGVEAVIHDRISLSDLPTFFADHGIPKEKTQMISAAIAGRVFLPLEKYIGNVAEQIQAWGGKAESYSSTPVAQSGQMTAEKLVASTLEEKQLQHPDENLRHRLELALIAYVKGVRDENETSQILMRPAKVGGLELSEDVAERIIKEIDNAKGFTDIVADEPPPKPAVQTPTPPIAPPTPIVPTPPPAPTPSRAPAPPPMPVKSVSQPVLAPKPKPIAALPVQPMATQGKQPAQGDLAAAIDAAVEAAGIAFASDDLKKRFRSIVESRLRDVRNAFETQALLEVSVEKNGMGLRGRQLTDVMEKIEQAADEYQATLVDVKKQEKAHVLQRKQDAEQIRSEAFAKREDELLAKRYTSITGKSASSAPLPEPRAPQSGPADAAKVKQAVDAVRAQSTPPPPRVRPKVTDVTFSRTLSGPVEELRIMDLTDFRRLSKNPEEAALKIKDKIDLLEEQGFEKRIAGIKAWRLSPVNQLYLLLSQEALMSGKGMAAILDERKAAGKETLSHDELQAIMGLNAHLRF